jgi:hypothetical protein
MSVTAQILIIAVTLVALLAVLWFCARSDGRRLDTMLSEDRTQEPETCLEEGAP